MIDRRQFVATLGAMAAAGSLPAFAQQRYPHSTVTLVTHSSPGAGSDLFLRELGQHLDKILGVNFAVENVSGGSGAKALSYLAKKPADGSIFFAISPTYINTSLLSKLDADYTDLEPLVNIFYDPQVLFVRADSEFKTLADVIDRARKGGRAWAADNPSSIARQALENIKKLTGVDARIATHDGGADALLNVLNGSLDVGVGELAELKSQIDGKQVRLIAALTEKRLDAFPDLPTAREGGVDVVLRKFRGLAGPKGLPADVIALWEDAIQKLLADETYKAKYLANNLVPSFQKHDEYVKFIDVYAAETKEFFVKNGIIAG
jgi:tripartite-type tricarboxylate transporter receptor subunit TctC